MIEASSDFKRLLGVGGAGDVTIHYDVGAAEGQDDATDTTADDADTDLIADGDKIIPAPAGATSGAAIETNDADNGDASVDEMGVNAIEGKGKRQGGVVVIGDTALEFYGFNKKINQKYVDIINNFDDKYRGTVSTTALIAPTNIEFKIPKEYRDLTDSQHDAIQYIYSNLNDDVAKIAVYDTLAKHSGEYVYFRTDHHWTALGAYYAYWEYVKALGLPHTALLSYPQVRLDGFLGSFYNAIGGNKEMKNNPDYVLAYEPVVPYTMYGYNDSKFSDKMEIRLVRKPEEILNKNKYLAFSGGDLPVIDIKMQSNTGRRLIIFKESFANAFIPFLTENYDEILVVDFRYFEGDVDKLIADYKINEALFINYVSAAGSEKQTDRLKSIFK
jgi:hypothetical protein